jgi:hypothetical protein
LKRALRSLNLSPWSSQVVAVAVAVDLARRQHY